MNRNSRCIRPELSFRPICRIPAISRSQLTEWAKKRVADGGAPIKIRIVKGANMEMELVESSLHNWPLGAL